MNSNDPIEVTVDRPGGGAAAVGRRPDGKTVFVDGALPGERVSVTITQDRKRWSRGDVVEILNPSAERITPRCPTHHDGCGGCDLAHLAPAAQHGWKAHVVADAIERIGKVAIPPISAVPIDEVAHRTTVRLVAAEDGRLGHRRRRSHAPVPIQECGVVVPELEAVIRSIRLDPATTGRSAPEVFIRWSTAEQRAIVVVDEPEEVTVDGSLPISVHGRSAFSADSGVHLAEHAGGHSWRVSAGSFFQSGPLVVDALVAAVGAAIEQSVSSSGRLVDAYAGIGIFAGTIGRGFDSVQVIESAASSVADARVNLADLDAEIIESPVETAPVAPADVVIADPARAGLGADGVAALAASKAPVVVLVSCDTGSLGRDVGLLATAGWTAQSVSLVDAFPDTSHVEAVTLLCRSS